MKYTIDKRDKYCIITLEVEKLDTTQAPALKSEFVTLEAEGMKHIIIDLSAVKYIDSSGLSALLTGNRVVANIGGAFVITNLNDHVMKLIKISQLENVLNIFDTVKEAEDAVVAHETSQEGN